jgi:hypothetical protein
MQQIVINACFGGFSLSYEGLMAYAKEKGVKLYPYVEKRNGDRKNKEFEPFIAGKNTGLIFYFTKPLKNGKWAKENDCYFYDREIKRDDPALVAVIKKLGKKASGECANLKIVEIPDDVKWVIGEYDGNECVEEAHQSWG